MSTIYSIGYRTYKFGSKGRQALDSASIMMPGISKSQIANAGIFLLIYNINNVLASNPGINVREAYEKVIDPIREITYEDLLKAVSPTSKDQTPLDDYIGVRVVKSDRYTGEIIPEPEPAEVEKEDEYVDSLFADSDEPGDESDERGVSQ